MGLTLDRQNAYRSQYQRMHPGWHSATKVYEESIRLMLQPNSTIVDIGCGRGGVLEQLAGETQALSITTIGFDPDLISLREHRMPSLRRAETLAGALPLPATSADLILSSWVFEHLDDPLQVLSEFRRVLKPGGRAIFLTPNARSLIALINRTLRPLQRWLVPRLYGRAEADTFPVVYLANTRLQIVRLAQQAGLRLERILHIEDPTYLAFNPLLFRLSLVLTRLTPPVHLIGILQRDS